MSINFTQFHAGVVKPSLLLLGPVIPYTAIADLLVTETIWHESDRLRALGQYPRGGVTEHGPFGPGLGIASIEQPTWDWLKEKDRVRNMLGLHRYEELAWDLQLNVTACRLRYLVNPMPLPKLEDGVEARATYWWRTYNGGQVDRRHDYIFNAKAIPWKAGLALS